MNLLTALSAFNGRTITVFKPDNIMTGVLSSVSANGFMLQTASSNYAAPSANMAILLNGCSTVIRIEA